MVIILFAAFACGSVVVDATQYSILTQFLNATQSRALTLNPVVCPSQPSYPSARMACDPITRKIIGLNLYLAVLNGNLSSSSSALTQLTDLTYLNLSNNNLVGPIDSLTRLTGLTALDVSYNAFTGDALSVVQKLPNLIGCVLQMSSPLDTNCFTGFVAANASLCNNANLNPLYLCRNYIPRITTTAVGVTTTTTATATTTTTTTTTNALPTTSTTTTAPIMTTYTSTTAPTTTTTNFLTSSTTILPIASSLESSTTISDTVVTSPPPPPSLTTTLIEKMSLQKPSNPVSSVSILQQQQQQVVIACLGVVVALLYVAFAAYFVFIKLRKRADEQRRGRHDPLAGRLLSSTEILSISDRETDESGPVSAAAVVNVAKSEYGPIHLPAEQPSTSDGYSSLPASLVRGAAVASAPPPAVPLPPPFVPADVANNLQHNYDRVPAPAVAPTSLNGSGSSTKSDEQNQYDEVKVRKPVIYDIVKVPSSRTVYENCESSLN